MKRLSQVLLTVLALLMMLTTVVGAAAPYATYTYSSTKFVLNSPEAYVPDMVVNSSYMGLTKALDDPRDLFVGPDENVYLVDAKNARVICLDKYLKVRFEIATFVNSHGVPDSFSDPSGVFVNDKYIYVCDSNNNRIVMFHLDGTFYKVIPQPVSDLFDEGAIYKPVAVAVDSYGRLFVVSSTTYQGIIVMSDDGGFHGFIGAAKVEISPIEILWRNLQTDAQRELSSAYIPTEYNNITIDEDNFIYITTDAPTDSEQMKSIQNKSGENAAVKKLNASGADVMRRNGFFGPGGEVAPSTSSLNAITGASRIIDAAVGPEGTWSIIDEKRSKVYTYDKDGACLFIFGDKGIQTGNIENIEAIAYQGSKILLLDKSKDCITVYRRTEYGDLLIDALAHQNARIYDVAIDDWTEILKRNNNYDAAYIGIGKALYRSGDYEEAMEYYRAAFDTTNYSNAFKEVRKGILSKWLVVLVIGVVLVCVLIGKFFGYAGKINKKAQLKVGRKSLKEEMLYPFHLIFHPFDGFWDLKHEKRGSVRSAFLILVITIAAFTYQGVGTGYIFNPRQSGYLNIFGQILSVSVPLLLWVVANWCLTTLFEGEGSLKDIFVAACYSLTPMPLLIIPSVILSNVLAASEVQIINLLVDVAFIWMFVLLFLGMMVTHDYSMLKNVATTVGTIVGMAFIMFLALLFSSLMAKIVGFISGIIVEINYRM
ncbi:MAG: YIP1 family protein [Clostridia bacterium]|nr:YIP1 family protein [Clostridia bacterium]